MEYWIHPPIEKVFEALGAIADSRVEMFGNKATVTSSSRGKSYCVEYDPEICAIMSNDNLSFYKGVLGYPAIAYLLTKGVITYEPRTLPLLKNVPWKDLNTRFKGNFRKTLETVLEKLTQEDSKFLQEEALRIHNTILSIDFPVLGAKIMPPEGY